MAQAAGRIGIKVMSVVIGIPVGIAARKGVERVWAATHPDDRPRKPSEAGVRWSDAIVWAVMSAAGVVLADLISRRTAEGAYRALTGNEPPVKSAEPAPSTA